PLLLRHRVCWQVSVACQSNKRRRTRTRALAYGQGLRTIMRRRFCLPTIDNDAITLTRWLNNCPAAGRAFAADLHGAHSIFRFDTQTEWRPNHDAHVWIWSRFNNAATARSRFLDDVKVCKCGTYRHHERNSCKKFLHLILRLMTDQQ